MDNNHISPDELCFYEGLFELILFICTFIGFSFYDNKNYFFEIFEDDKDDKDDKIDLTQIILISIFMILNFIYNLLIYFTIKYYHPYYIINILIIQEIGYNLLDNDINVYIKIITGLIALIFIFSFLIFNEIIEINFLGLEKNLKRNIGIRADRETLTINTSLHTIKYEKEEEDDDKDDNIGEVKYNNI